MSTIWHLLLEWLHSPLGQKILQCAHMLASLIIDSRPLQCHFCPCFLRISQCNTHHWHNFSKYSSQGFINTCPPKPHQARWHLKPWRMAEGCASFFQPGTPQFFISLGPSKGKIILFIPLQVLQKNKKAHPWLICALFLRARRLCGLSNIIRHGWSLSQKNGFWRTLRWIRFASSSQEGVDQYSF